MNKFKFYFIALSSVLFLFSCNKSDDLDYEILHDYGVQDTYDTGIIQDYLKTHYIETVVDHPGFSDDQDITFGLITDPNTQQSLWDSPLLDSIDVVKNTHTYKIYFLKLREGDPAGKSPSRADAVLASYDGAYLKYITTQDTISTNPIVLSPDVTKLRTYRFDRSLFPTSYFALDQVITGWQEIFPLFKSGIYDAAASEGGPAIYNNFGAGVMFVPSGLAYYNTSVSSVPAYAQLMFKFKLYDVKRTDQDDDKILSNDEDINGNGIFTDDDTDGDGIANYLDTDDDGDGFLTKNEILIPGTGPGTAYPPAYYPYNGAAVDDPATPQIDERQGIPRKFTGPIDPITNLHTPLPEDYTDPTRLRRHIDITSFSPYW